jgi:Acetyltransferases, including N-acetylases of ribosomal proteins
MMITQGDLILRRFCKEDRNVLVQLADNANVTKYMSLRFPSPYHLEDADNWFALIQNEKQPFNMAIEWQGRFVGGIGAESHSGQFARTAELGYWLGEPYWGLGLAARAVAMFTPYVFNELAFIRIQAEVLANNHNSMRVLEKNGFKREGILHGQMDRNGLACDAVLYAKLSFQTTGPV